MQYIKIRQMLLPQNYIKVGGSERSPRKGATLIGPADPNESVSLSIRVRRRPGSPPIPDMEHWSKTQPGQRKFISREDFASQYGAAQEDLDKVAGFATANGLMVGTASIPRRTVEVTGTVAQVSKAFAVQLGLYKSATETYRGREGAVHIPADLDGIVEGIFGLDNRRMARRHGTVDTIPATIRGNAQGTAQGGVSLNPIQVAGLYDFPKMPKAATQTIALLEFSDNISGLCGYLPSDITAYFTTNLGIGPGPIPPVLTSVVVDGAANSPGGPNCGEVALDIAVAGAVAQGAKIAVYFAPFTEKGWVDILSTVLHDTTNAPTVLSISWAWTELESFNGELAWTTQAIDAVSSMFREAAFMGMTVLAASGDNGSNCQIGDKNAHVYYPSSDPWVTSCGGTSIQNVSGSAFSEVTWNDNGVTGGGISDVFDLPLWQTAANIPLSVNANRRKGRGIPDIAGYANGYTIVLQGASSPGWWGTSETAPLYAGLVAVINACLGKPVGYLNPTLYQIAREPGQTVFREINDGGSNAVSPAPGYKTGPGWNACTGWGSVNGAALMAALLQPNGTRSDHPAS